MNSILDKLIQENEFPVVFIGAGISRRFLMNFPDWTGLLEEFWKKSGQNNFYGELNNIKDAISRNHPEMNERELNHYTNIEVGSLIEGHFNEAFNNASVKIDGFTPRDAYEKKISPFKLAISNRFKEYTLKGEIEEEYEAFKKMLAKTQIILTTNYDEFIEDSYNSDSNYKVTKYVGQKGFFKETYGYAELYKLHGCVTQPNDVVIAKNDYDKFEQNSVLISAKIISLMMHSPIIFLGYSLTDVNVRKIIRDFTRSLTEDRELEILEERLVLIERAEGEQDFVEEVVNDKDLGCKLRVIKTDNFERVFKTISTINQGIAPTEVRKYQHVIKELIIDRGKKGALKSVLLSPEELDSLEGNLQHQNITVALGDAKYIFQIPDIITYCLDYISDNDEISTDIRMRFAAQQNSRSRIPMNKFLEKSLIDSSSLHSTEKTKLENKIPRFSNLTEQIGSINRSSVFNSEAHTLEEIVTPHQKIANKYETISFNINRLNLEEVKAFLLKELEDLKDRGEIKISTQLRRLLLIYDIKANKRDNA